MTISLPLSNNLDLDACPHCGRARPRLTATQAYQSKRHDGSHKSIWFTYFCSVCGCGTLAGAKVYDEVQVMRLANKGVRAAIGEQFEIIGVYPSAKAASDDLPNGAKKYLQQAILSVAAPDGAVMLAAASVDAMLKEKQLVHGSLYSRINLARDQHLITPEMAQWAHEVRLESNDVRHADQSGLHHTTASAEQVIDFTIALGEFLFVLPARVARGRYPKSVS